MFTREELLKSPEYWFEGEQNELYRQLEAYMEKENLNQSELAKKLNVSKGYISQILNGNSNFSLKKLIEFCLSIDLVPKIKYQSVEQVIAIDEQFKILNDFRTGGVIKMPERFTGYSEPYTETIVNDGVLGISA